MKKLFIVLILFISSNIFASQNNDLINLGKVALVQQIYQSLMNEDQHYHEMDFIEKYGDDSLNNLLKQYYDIVGDDDPDSYLELMVFGQDPYIKNLKVSIDDNGIVYANFTSYDEPYSVPFKFNCKNNQCLITDVNNVKEELSTFISQHKKENSSSLFSSIKNKLFNQTENSKNEENSNIQYQQNAINAPKAVEQLDTVTQNNDELPSVWHSNFIQGKMEYYIENSQGQSLSITCSEHDEYDPEVDHGIYFSTNQDSYSASSLEGELAFLINGNVYYPLSMPTVTTNGARAWDEFTQAIATANKFAIYLHNKKVAEFSPTPQSVQQHISTIKEDCPAMAYSY